MTSTTTRGGVVSADPLLFDTRHTFVVVTSVRVFCCFNAPSNVRINMNARVVVLQSRVVKNEAKNARI